MKRWRLFAVLVAVFMLVGIASVVGCGGGENATAQPASPTATTAATATSPPATATPVATEPGDMPTAVYPYRVILSGPATAHPGDLITYDIRFECIREEQKCDGQAPIVFAWIRPVASSVESSPVAVDTSGALPPLNEMAVLNLSGPAGAAHVTLRIADRPTGDVLHADLGADVLGPQTGHSRYYWPEGSVVDVATNIVAEPTP